MIIDSLSPINPIGEIGALITININDTDYIFRYDYNKSIDIYSMAILTQENEILYASRYLKPISRELMGVSTIQNLRFPSFSYDYLIFLDNKNANVSMRDGFYQGGRYDLLALDQEGYDVIKL